VGVKLSRNGAVLTAMLDRPDRLNALDDSMHDGIAAAVRAAAAVDVRVLVVTGAGRGFCVGQDLDDLADRDVGALVRDRYNRNMRGLRALGKPVLAAVNGVAAGAGLALAAACDVRIASTDAVFVPAFVNLGLVPDSGSTHFLTRILGPARALEWMISNRSLDAAGALAWGLASELVDAGRLAERTAGLAGQLAALPAASVAMHKRLFEHAPLATLDEQLELEAQMQAAAAVGGEFAEGLAAFRERRSPRFADGPAGG